jgi:DNA-binding transcriptional ArsR family regulator
MRKDPSELFKVLGVETRLKILRLLQAEGPTGVKRIAEVLGMTPSAVSQHMKVLRQAGLASRKRSGYWVPYSVDEKGLDACCCMLIETCTCGCKGRGRRTRLAACENLTSLIERRRELERELRDVRARIARRRGAVHKRAQRR